MTLGRFCLSAPHTHERFLYSLKSLFCMCNVRVVTKLTIFSFHLLIASASKTYIGSVLFRASAFTGANLASGVPVVI